MLPVFDALPILTQVIPDPFTQPIHDPYPTHTRSTLGRMLARVGRRRLDVWIPRSARHDIAGPGDGKRDDCRFGRVPPLPGGQVSRSHTGAIGFGALLFRFLLFLNSFRIILWSCLVVFFLFFVTCCLFVCVCVFRLGIASPLRSRSPFPVAVISRVCFSFSCSFSFSFWFIVLAERLRKRVFPSK